MNETPLLLGGSRVYGFPREDSDWDVVVLTDPKTAEILRGAFARGGKSARNTSIKVGDLNIILATSREDYDTWAKGIKMLKARAPVEKAEAVRVFEELRARVHKHRFGDRRPGVHWEIKCQVDGCTLHQAWTGRVFEAGPRINCPKGCGLAYYRHEADEHSCWDS